MIAQPRRLFLIDCLGALGTCLLLSIVVANLEDTFGMPTATVRVLAAIACCFALYSFACFLLGGKRWRTLLKWIAVANLGYCALSLILVGWNASSLTSWGLAYFVGEVLVVLSLAVFEWKVSRYRYP